MTRPSATWTSVIFSSRDAISVDPAKPKRVPLLHSFGRDLSPSDFASGIPAELLRQKSQPIRLNEVSLANARRPGLRTLKG